MIDPVFKQCIKCPKDKYYDPDKLYPFSMHGEDTFDFSVCERHMKALWKFLGEEIQLND